MSKKKKHDRVPPDKTGNLMRNVHQSNSVDRRAKQRMSQGGRRRG